MKTNTEAELRAADELITDRTAGQAFACQRGCSWCCHQLIVMTNRDDGVAILDFVRRKLGASEFEKIAADIRQQARQISTMAYQKAEAGRWTCPFLRAGDCSIYELRPVACRTVLSADASCCKAMMRADRFDDLTMRQQTIATEIGERATALQIEINDRRKVTGAVEMRTLLASLLDTARDPARSGDA